MSSTTKLVDGLIEGLDDDLTPIEAAEDEKPTTDEDEAHDDAETDNSEDTVEEEAEDEDASDDEGYTIDEASGETNTDEEQPVTETKQDKENEKAYADLNPEQRYILENIQPITIRGTVGDSDEVKEFKAFDPSQLPAGFKYVDDRDRDIAAKAFYQLESKAISLQNDFRTKAQEADSKKFKEANDKADWEDIAYLQKEGELPKFKLKPTDEGFADDPAAKLIDEIQAFKDERNAKYLKDFQEKGRPFRMIGFEEAFRMYKPKAADDKTTKAQEKEDQERKNLAKRTNKTNGTKGDDGVATRVPLRSSRDMFNYIDSLDI